MVSIDPHVRLKIYSFKVQAVYSITAFCWKIFIRDDLSIPHDVAIREVFPLRQPTSRGKRNGNLFLIWIDDVEPTLQESPIIWIFSKLPSAVQTDPIFSAQLGTRMH